MFFSSSSHKYNVLQRGLDRLADGHAGVGLRRSGIDVAADDHRALGALLVHVVEQDAERVRPRSLGPLCGHRRAGLAHAVREGGGVQRYGVPYELAVVEDLHIRADGFGFVPHRFKCHYDFPPV